MSNVTSLPMKPVRAVFIRRTSKPPHGIVVAATVTAHGNEPARYMREVYSAPSLAAAWEIAWAEAKATGLPIIDLISPKPRGPGEGQRLAA